LGGGGCCALSVPASPVPRGQVVARVIKLHGRHHVPCSAQKSEGSMVDEAPKRSSRVYGCINPRELEETSISHACIDARFHPQSPPLLMHMRLAKAGPQMKRGGVGGAPSTSSFMFLSPSVCSSRHSPGAAIGVCSPPKMTKNNHFRPPCDPNRALGPVAAPCTTSYRNTCAQTTDSAVVGWLR